MTFYVIFQCIQSFSVQSICLYLLHLMQLPMSLPTISLRIIWSPPELYNQPCVIVQEILGTSLSKSLLSEVEFQLSLSGFLLNSCLYSFSVSILMSLLCSRYFVIYIFCNFDEVIVFFLSWININFTINPSSLSLWKKNNNNNTAAKIRLFSMVSIPCVGEINESKR